MIKDSKKLAKKIANILDNKKAIDVVILDISELSIIADFFVIASGRTKLQVKALCDEVEKKMSEEGIEIRHREGYREARWVVMDYGDVVVHIFNHEERAFYNLERLWSDAPYMLVDNS